MTEEEWLACTDPKPMLEFLGRKASDRRLRLFAAACCRRLWGSLNEDGRRAVEAAEGFADGLIEASELREAGVAAHLPVHDFYDAANLGGHGVVLTGELAASEAVSLACTVSTITPVSDRAAQFAVLALGDPAESVVQCRFLRDIFANPFRPPLPVSGTVLAWDDGVVKKIAEGIYDDQAFDRLPLMADALEEAGCDDDAILDHLRGPGPHVRGCWVVDLLLGKE